MISYELESSFETEVIQASHKIPILVDFWAPWCGPCQALGPVLEKLASEAEDKWSLVKINTENHPAVAQEYQIASIPVVKLFIDGAIVDEFNGALPESQIKNWLEHALPSAAAENLTRAKEMLETGNETEAAKLVSTILKETPDNDEAVLLSAEIAFSSAPQDTFDTLSTIKEDSDWHNQAKALITLATHRIEAQTPEALPESKGKSSYLQGLEALAQRDFKVALERLIESIEADRKFADESAIKLGKAIFQWLGIRHPIADKFYRRFTSVLYI